MLLGIFRFFRGYVDFTARGRFPERLLNLAARGGISVWNARPLSKGLEGSVSVSDYKRLRPLCRRAGVKTRVTRRHGLPFYAARYKNRWGLLAGAALGAIVLAALSQFVWTVDVIGAENLSDAGLKQSLAEHGLTQGSFKYFVDVEAIKRDVLLDVDGLKWMSVNLVGCTAQVEVKEKALKPELLELDAPCNIKAAADGVITGLNIARGTAQTEKGSAVSKGDLLVSGVELTKQNNISYVHAQAEIFADIYSDKELKIKKAFTYYCPAGARADRIRLNALWFSLPFSADFRQFEHTAFEETDYSAVLNGNRLPLGIAKGSSYELEAREFTLDVNTAKTAFTNLALLEEAFERGESEVKDRRLDIKPAGDAYVCEIARIYNENIAVTAEFNVTE